MKKRVFVSAFGVVLITMLTVMLGCDPSSPADSILSVDRNETAVNVGGNAVITVTASDTVTAVSRDEDIATVEVGTDNTVTITGVAAGETVVTITSGSEMVERVNVTAEDLVPGTTRTLNQDHPSALLVNSIGTDGNAASYTVASSDETIVTAEVSTEEDYTTLTPGAAGTATVTVTSAGGATASVEVTVTGDIEVLGTWQTPDGEYSEQWIISNTSIEYKSDTNGDGTYESTTYKAEVVSYVNGSFNAGDTSITDGGAASVDPGNAVIKYTEVDGAGTGEVGKYNIFRWCDTAGDEAKNDFVQGYKNVGDSWPDNVNGVFDSGSAAISGATNANGYFDFASSGAEKQ
jgi:hypothetical protein